MYAEEEKEDRENLEKEVKVLNLKYEKVLKSGAYEVRIIQITNGHRPIEGQ